MRKPPVNFDTMPLSGGAYEPPDAVSLPVGGFHNLGERGTLDATGLVAFAPPLAAFLGVALALAPCLAQLAVFLALGAPHSIKKR